MYRNTNDLYQIIVNKQLKLVKNEQRKAKKEFESVKKPIVQKLSFLEKTCLIRLLTKQFEDSAKAILKTHQKKLFNLWVNQRSKCPSCIVNLSNRKLNMAEEEALRLGLQHHIMPKKIREDSVIWSIAKLVYTLETRYKAEIDDETKDQIKFYFRKFMNEAKTIM